MQRKLQINYKEIMNKSKNLNKKSVIRNMLMTKKMAWCKMKKIKLNLKDNKKLNT